MEGSKKPKTPPKTKTFDKKNDVQDFWNARNVMFLDLDLKKKVLEGVFVFF